MESVGKRLFRGFGENVFCVRMFEKVVVVFKEYSLVVVF